MSTSLGPRKDRRTYPQQGGVSKAYPKAIFFAVNADPGLLSGTFWGLLYSGISVSGEMLSQTAAAQADTLPNPLFSCLL